MGKPTLILLFFFIIFLCAVGNEEKSNTEEKKTSAIFSLPTTTITTSTSKLKTLLNRARAYFFPPNLDFRGSDEAKAEAEAEAEAEAKANGGGGIGHKVKEAAVKSKATVEDSAKSTAKLAGETMQKTVNKVKQSLSGTGRDPDPQRAEL
uniref:Uncharacterized protein n=1 Tax=Davidia involucrata TaxID=16924 RepID=A0A5B6ZNK7_DAVIN